MKKFTKFHAVVILILVALISCQSARERDNKKISALENELFSESGTLNKEKVDELITAYFEFSEKFPADSLSPEYLFKAGDIAMNTNRSKKAIECYGKIIKEYSDYKKAPEALFLIGYVYENNLGLLPMAKSIYEEFLVKYPDNEFADDAEVSLKFLGKTPEELIEEFQKQADEQAKEKE